MSVSAIAISYRREDTLDIAGRIYDRLIDHYGREAVYRDIDKRMPGFDFRDNIKEHIARCHIMLVIIGANWRGPQSDGTFRIDDEKDFVREEVQAGLERNIPVIPVLISPVLVNNALTQVSMPTPAQLPASLKSLSYRDAVTVDPGADFDFHVNRLIEAMNKIFAGRGIKVSPPTKVTPQTRTNITPASKLMWVAAGALIFLALYRFSRDLTGMQNQGVGPWFARSPWNLPEFVVLVCFAPFVAYSTLRGSAWSRVAALGTCAFGVFDGLFFIFNPVVQNLVYTLHLLVYTLVYAFCSAVYGFFWSPPLRPSARP